MTSNIAERPEGSVTHPKCGGWWVGRTVSHCSSCCESFSGISTFDKHQQLGGDGALRCRKPQDVGLVAIDQAWGRMWTKAGTRGTAPEIRDLDDGEEG